jgi:HJR/Mrr/RecB family endonuclease
VESLPDFKWYESVDSFLLELSKLYVSTLASVKNTYNNQYPGQTLISDQDLEQIVTQALRKKCKIIAENQMKYFSGKGESAMNRI